MSTLVDTGIVAINTIGRNDPASDLHHLKRVEGKPVRAYTCGPTVYSEAHLGHARTYISLDMIRRILTDYWKIPVMWCMNVTDIDDKIINAFNEGKTGFDSVFKYSSDRERAFFVDMDRLNVRRPDSLLRVSEVIEEIKEFIADLIKRGYAYEVDGSVYFDVPKYVADGYKYAELEQGSFSENNRQTQKSEDAEKSKKRSNVDLSELGKHDPADFALWKKAKEGEPFWPSAWGNGRPGWHIECSTMSGLFFGDQFDVHCGGIDLRFPHHTNEIAQSQARSGVTPWVRTWWHTGQLNINGEKMAKSTGNFKSVKQALNAYSWRLIRMMFALVEWDNPLELNEDLIENATNALKVITNFLQKCEGLLQTGAASDVHGFSEVDRKFADLLYSVQERVRNAFSQNFKVPVAIQAIRELIKEANTEPYANNALLISAARFVRQIMDVLGFNLETLNLSAGETAGMGPVAETMAKYRQTSRATARSMLQDVKAMKELLGVNTKGARPEDEAEAKKFDAVKLLEEHVMATLQQLDNLRDEALPALGIKLEDAGDQVEFKLGSPEEMKALVKQAQASKAKQTKEPAKPKPAKEVLHPIVMFKGKYKLNAELLPETDGEGKPLTRGQMNKARKVWKEQIAKWAKANPGQEEPKPDADMMAPPKAEE